MCMWVNVYWCDGRFLPSNVLRTKITDIPYVGFGFIGGIKSIRFYGSCLFICWAFWFATFLVYYFTCFIRYYLSGCNFYCFLYYILRFAVAVCFKVTASLTEIWNSYYKCCFVVHTSFCLLSEYIDSSYNYALLLCLYV